VTGALVTAVVTLMAIVVGSGCEARSSVEGAQTAVAVAQTALPGLQTAVPGIQATAQAGATVVSGVLADPRAINLQLQTVLAGATVDVKATPDTAANEAVAQVQVSATDARGTFAQLDPLGRQASGSAALVLVGQYYPNASVALSVVDDAGAALATGTRAPGQLPQVQMP
jgi:hypothetical protein